VLLGEEGLTAFRVQKVTIWYQEAGREATNVPLGWATFFLPG